MILIISKEQLEISTEEVCEWIDYLGSSFNRINGEKIYMKDSIEININNDLTKISLTNEKELMNEYKIGWFRRWSDQDYLREIENANILAPVYSSLSEVLTSDELDIRRYILNSIKVEKWLTDPKFAGANKLQILQKANSFGLMIPSTIVCTTKVALINFYNAHKRIIIKDISAPFSYYKENMRILSLTTEITECELENIPEKFYPSLFQELIEKKYELRVFYLEEICYSMAIFSQNDKQTSVDFRNYNHTKPNRRIPYNLPIEIKLKVVALMKDLNLETGSIDFIVTTSGDYIFLEVNPVGQFGMTSYPCNYYLEKKVAEYLIKNENG